MRLKFWLKILSRREKFEENLKSVIFFDSHCTYIHREAEKGTTFLLRTNLLIRNVI